MSEIRDGRNDFDFLRGRWQVRNRRLGGGVGGWTGGGGVTGGGGDLAPFGGGRDVGPYEVTLPDGSALSASSLRIFNPVAGLWSIYWVDDRRCELFPPVDGRFSDGVGVFEGEDVEGGIPVRVRFGWSGMTNE